MAKTLTIAAAARQLLIDYGQKHGIADPSIGWGDLTMLHEVAQLANMKPAHPLDLHIRVLNALDKSRLFEKSRFHAHDSRGRPRVCRSFRLKSLTKPTLGDIS